MKKYICFSDRLHKLDGTAVDFMDLENGKQYVAVGHNESFKDVNYGSQKDWKMSTVKSASKYVTPY